MGHGGPSWERGKLGAEVRGEEQSMWSAGSRSLVAHQSKPVGKTPIDRETSTHVKGWIAFGGGTFGTQLLGGEISPKNHHAFVCEPVPNGWVANFRSGDCHVEARGRGKN